jgi:hypothetical protein
VIHSTFFVFSGIECDCFLYKRDFEIIMQCSEHLRKAHPDEVNMDLRFFKSLQNKFEKQPTLSNMFCNASQQNTDGLLAAYNISLLIAKSGQPHTIGRTHPTSC